MRSPFERRSDRFLGQATHFGAGLVILIGLVGVLPIPPAVVERFFSNGFFPVLQPWLTRLSNLVPFALLDGLLASLVIWWSWRAVGDLRRDRSSLRQDTHRRRWWRFFGRLAVRTVGLALCLYAAFLVTWGLNYRRLPLANRLVLDDRAPDTATGTALALTAVRSLNALVRQAHGSGAEAPAATGVLADAFGRTQRLLGVRHPATPARPKTSLLDPLFTRAGVAGMTDPFFLETLVASDLLPIERPFVVAHEWAHLAGFNDEGEANFVGWLTSIRGGPIDQYSGWLFLYSETTGGLPRQARADASSHLDEDVRADLRAINARIRGNVSPRVAASSWQVYDRYLRANRVEAGTASYNDVVRLVLSARFDEAWAPALK